MDRHPDAISLPLDYFVSYTKADREIADWITWCLEDADYTTIYAPWDFRPGANFVLKMHEAASKARQTIAIISKEYSDSLYAQPEWAAAFRNDPVGTDRKLIPVRVTDWEPEGLLASMVYIDLVPCLQKGDEEGAKRELLQGLQEGRAKPRRGPVFNVSDFGNKCA